MRIIGGKFKSRNLVFPKTRATRPTMDRVRETLFNVIGVDVLNANILDLYAGSGSLGLEAISRGAKSVTFVDYSSNAIRAIIENIHRLSVENFTFVIKKKVAIYLKEIKHNTDIFDIIFMDAPYSSDETKKNLMYLYQFDILAPAGILVVEHSIAENLVLNNNYTNYKCKKIGDTQLSFFLRI